MTVQQISVFAESKPGHVSNILEIFGKEGINVRGFSAGDTGEYGIVRFIVDKPDEALAILKSHNCACAQTPVLCIRLKDEPGELARVMRVLASCDINVIYSYSMISAYIVLSVSDIERAERLLANEPVECATQDDIPHLRA